MNTVATLINLVVIVFIVIVGLIKANGINWSLKMNVYVLNILSIDIISDL